MTCRLICKKDRRFKPFMRSRYIKGIRRCIHCTKSIQTTDVLCPCCKNRLRYTPRNPKYRGEEKRY